MSSKAVLLPTPADPALLTLWFKYFQVWKKEIDQLYVYANTPDLGAAEVVHKLCKKNGARFFYTDHQLEHGEVLQRLINHSKEDRLMFVEDDGFIFTPGYVEKFFNLLDHYDVIGSPRGSCSIEILDKAQAKYDLDYSGEGDKGPNFWPNFFFVKREVLKNVTHYGAQHYDVGDKIPGLGTAENICAGDTMVHASLELRNTVPKDKILEIPQYHGATDDFSDYHSGKNIWDGRCWWTHVGSLSSGYLNLLDMDKPLPDGFNSEQEKLELERRITFWEMGNDEYKDEEYGIAIARLVNSYALSHSRIGKRKTMYREVMDQWLQTSM